MDPPRNRKQRRAAATASQTDFFDPSSIPLAHPPPNDPSKPHKNGRTLVDMIAERQGQLEGTLGSSGSQKGIETKYVAIDPDTGEISPFDQSSVSGTGNEGQLSEDIAKHEEDIDDYDPISPFIDTVLLSIPLTVLHLTLGYLAAHQYAQSIELDVLFRNSGFVAFPTLTLLIHLAHGHIISFHRGQGESETISLFPWHPEKLSFSFLRKLLFPPSLKTVIFLLRGYGASTGYWDIMGVVYSGDSRGCRFCRSTGPIGIRCMVQRVRHSLSASILEFDQPSGIRLKLGHTGLPGGFIFPHKSNTGYWSLVRRLHAGGFS